MHPYLRLVRAGNVAISFAGTLVAGLAARGDGLGLAGPLWVDLLLAAASTACVTAAGNVLNDLLDLGSDRVNHPDRPLVTGAIRPSAARGLTAALFVAAPLLALPVVLDFPFLGVILGAAIVALLAYEFRFKSGGVPGNLLVAFLTGAVFLYGGAAVGDLLPVLPLAALATLATLSREVIKDMEDSAGDVDRRTLPRTHGPTVAARLAQLSVGLAIALSPVPVLTVLAGHAADQALYLGLVLLSDLAFVASVWRLPLDLHRAQSLSKGAMSLALLAFLATAFR